jgi:hypothetical protein
LSRIYVKPAYEDAPCNIACGPPKDVEMIVSTVS